MLDWNEIDTVLLDMDGTLLDLHYDNYFWSQHLPKRYAEMKCISESEAKTFLEQFFHDLKGTLNWYCFDHWTELLDVDLVSLKHEVKHKIAFRPHAQTFLKLIADAHYKVALVTNSHRAGVEIKLQCTNLGDYIDEVHTSHDFGLPKEDPAFWRALHKVLPYDPKRTVFFDDNEDVLLSAKKAGLIHLVNIAQPDSQRAPRLNSQFPLLGSFLDILPNP